MTPEAQRIAIAKARRWKPDPETGFWYHLYSEIAGFRDGAVAPLPDYLNDLNAAREAVLSIPKDQRNRYVNELQEIIDRDNGYELRQPDLDFYWCNASAKQMSEAFLRTLELWTDQ